VKRQRQSQGGAPEHGSLETPIQDTAMAIAVEQELRQLLASLESSPLHDTPPRAPNSISRTHSGTAMSSGVSTTVHTHANANANADTDAYLMLAPPPPPPPHNQSFAYTQSAPMPSTGVAMGATGGTVASEGVGAGVGAGAGTGVHAGETVGVYGGTGGHHPHANTYANTYTTPSPVVGSAGTGQLVAYEGPADAVAGTDASARGAGVGAAGGAGVGFSGGGLSDEERTTTAMSSFSNNSSTSVPTAAAATVEALSALQQRSNQQPWKGASTGATPLLNYKIGMHAAGAVVGGSAPGAGAVGGGGSAVDLLRKTAQKSGAAI